jgi:hypothetical protein
MKPSLVPQHFPRHRNPATLSIAELLAAREAWHVPLSNMHNVVGTAIGLYRFRKKDPSGIRPRASRGERTLANSEARKNETFPCVLVFVKEWIDLDQFVADNPQENLQHVVPQFLYTSDGLVVPTCVIKVDLDETPDPGVSKSELGYPNSLFGGGCPLLTTVQGMQHFGTAGCLVTDGERRYALTSRHVAGVPRQEVFAVARGNEEKIGSSSPVQIERVKFSELYKRWPLSDTMCTMDAGLVEIDDATRWTSQLYAVGELDATADLNSSNITMDIIGTRVKTYGSRSHIVEGEIQGLFPRYKSIAGVDYVADLLIGPRHEALFRVQPGDSGALWVYDPETPPEPRRFKPVALNWGAMELAGNTKPIGFALATLMSNICQVFNVDIVTGHNTGFRTVWGAANHVTIAKILGTVMMQSKDNVSAFMKGSSPQKALDILDDLATVPDKWSQIFMGKKEFYRGRDEGPNHYADLDIKDSSTTLMAVPLTPVAWEDFYKEYEKEHGSIKHGALPFRAGQIFDDMVKYLKQGKSGFDEFFCAAGALSHYIMDACNPAHVSRSGKGNIAWDGKKGDAFHSKWDSATIPQDEVVSRVLKKLPAASKSIANGTAAANAAFSLMKRTLSTIDVSAFADQYEDAGQGIKAAVDFIDSGDGQKKLAAVVADCCLTWFSLVKSALHLAFGAKKAPSNVDWSRVDWQTICGSGNKDSFLVSKSLDKYIKPV